jgi:multidrug efflux pump
MFISLTTTPMMCAHLLKEQRKHGWMYNKSEQVFTWVVDNYGRTLTTVLRHPLLTLVILIATIALNVFLFIRVPKGFFPQQDNGRMMGAIQADQDTSFQAMNKVLQETVAIVDKDPAVDTVNGFTGGGGGSTTNTARMFISLKPLSERKITVDQVIGRLRPKLAHIPGATLFLQASQDLRVGGRSSSAQYQFTLRGDNLAELQAFAPRMLEQLKQIHTIADVNSDQQNHGLQALVE